MSVVAAVGQSIVGLGRSVVDTVLPACCPLCRALHDGGAGFGGLCGTCWGQLFFLGSSGCARCGVPLPVVVHEPDLVCGGCQKEPPAFDACQSVWVYDRFSRPLILRLKHQGDMTLLPFLTTCLRSRMAAWIAWADWVVPVPLHWTRLWWRGFNQAALFARDLDRKRYAPWGLKRYKRTSSMEGKNRTQRAITVRQAFGVPSFYGPRVRGKKVLLVDDVLTTGATLNEAAKALKKAGAREVRAVTLGRVVLSRF